MSISSLEVRMSGAEWDARDSQYHIGACGACADQKDAELRYVTPQQAGELKEREFANVPGRADRVE